MFTDIPNRHRTKTFVSSTAFPSDKKVGKHHKTYSIRFFSRSLCRARACVCVYAKNNTETESMKRSYRMAAPHEHFRMQHNAKICSISAFSLRRYGEIKSRVGGEQREIVRIQCKIIFISFHSCNRHFLFFYSFICLLVCLFCISLIQFVVFKSLGMQWEKLMAAGGV